MRSRSLCLSLSALAMLVLAPLAAQGANCKIVDHIGNRYSIGLHPIGKPLLQVMSAEAAQKCGAATGLCRMSDQRGAIFESHLVEPIEKSVIERVTAIGDGTFNGTLLAGVTFGDKIFDAVHKLRALPMRFADWNFSYDHFGSVLDTGACLRAANGAIWSYRLEFDLDGRLIRAEARGENYPEPAP
ncbi:MAG: hypothetical protein JNL25_00850 [Rhodospirillaceae bacterium]|nr:hypothetical protein [Rhodospirillaceae bacterium]